jgi:uncharacterized protein YdhG (YjbR/CyaY superfamily)
MHKPLTLTGARLRTLLTSRQADPAPEASTSAGRCAAVGRAMIDPRTEGIDIVRSKAENVDDYLAEAPPERRDALVGLRRACVEGLVGFTESMEYGMPAYSRDGVVEVGFASQKHYVSLYVLRTDVFDAHRPRLDGLSLGKGCIRYRRSGQIDFEVVESMLAATMASTGQVC